MINANEARERLVEKAATNSEFRELLVRDPNKAVEDEFGITVPKGFSIKVHEQSSTEAHLVLPPVSRLEDEDLRTIAGSGGACWG